MSDLELPKTKLVLRDGTLFKQGKGDAITARYPMPEITHIRIEKTAEYFFPGLLIALFAALAVVAKVYIPSAGLAWAASIVCVAIAGLSVLMVYGRKVVVETKNGTAAYPVADTFEEAQGFVISMRQALSESNALGNERANAAPDES